jgi:hypothetical protein
LRLALLDRVNQRELGHRQKQYLGPISNYPVEHRASSNLWRKSIGTILATRSAFTGGDWPVSRARTAAQGLSYVELLRRRMRVRFGGTWIADSG